MTGNPNAQHPYVPQTPTLPAPNQGYPPQQQPFDTTGQVAPPGMKPRVTATLWEDEGSLCFQVEAKGVCVARREGKIDSFRPVREAQCLHIVQITTLSTAPSC